MGDCKSCAGCKWLYEQDRGYSNYTVESSELVCIMDNNQNLPAELPYDWNHHYERYDESIVDNWGITNNSRCGLYENVSPHRVTADVDLECGKLSNYFLDYDEEVLSVLQAKELIKEL